MSAVRFTSRDYHEVRVLHDAGWGPREIQRILRDRGMDPVPSHMTIWRWVNPEGHQRHREQTNAINRARRAGSARFVFPLPRGPEWKEQKMRLLRAQEGLSFNAIAKIMTFDFPDDPWTEDEVRDLLKDVTKGPRRMEPTR